MNQKGAVPLTILIAVFGGLVAIAIFNYAPIQDQLLSTLNPKKQSFAQTSSQWEAERQLFNTEWSSAFIAGTGNTIHFTSGSGNISYRKSIDEGLTLGSPLAVGSGSLYLDDALAAEGSNLYLQSVSDIRTVTDFIGPRPVGNVYVRRSINDGQTWSTPVKLTNAQGALRIGIAASGSNVHVVWMDYRSLNVWDLYYARSIDGGVTWQPEVKLVAGANDVGAERPVIATSGNSVHIAWMDGRDNNPSCIIETGALLKRCTEVYYKRSLDNGITWETDKKLTNDSTKYSGRPDIAALNNTVLIGFDHVFDGTGVEQATLRSINNGTDWSNITRISNAANDSTHGSVILGGTMAHIAWFDYRNPGNTEIYYRMSKDLGATWESEERVTNSAGNSSTPLLSLTNNYLHVTFLDDRSGSMISWYKRRNLASSTSSPSPSSIKPGDLDSDNDVDIFDYNQLLTDFGKTQAGLAADIDKNDKVDIFDYNLLLTNFGK